MLLYELYNSPQITHYLVYVYLFLYYTNFFNFINHDLTPNRLRLRIGRKLVDYEYGFRSNMYIPPSKFNYYYIALWGVFMQIGKLVKSDLLPILCHLIEIDRFCFAILLILIHVTLLPLIIFFYFLFIFYWFLALLYYWVRFKIWGKKTTIPFKCRIHDFIPKYFRSYKPISHLGPTAYHGGIKYDTHWRTEPLWEEFFPKLFLKYSIELLIWLIIKRPYVLALGLWGQFALFITNGKKLKSISTLLPKVLNPLLYVIILGISYSTIDLVVHFIDDCPLWSRRDRFESNSMTKKYYFWADENVRYGWHFYFVDGTFTFMGKFGWEVATVVNSSPFTIETEIWE